MTVSHLLGAASAAALLAASGMSHTASAASLIFSTEQPEAVDGPNGTTTRFADDDFVRYDLDTQIGVIEITGSDINPDPSPSVGLPDPNAVFVGDNGDGNLIFSLQSGSAGFPGFNDDDLVEFDRLTGDLSLFFSFDEVMVADGGRDVDVDGFHLNEDGTFLVANTFDFTLGGMDFENGDIAVYDPVTDMSSELFSESLFGGADARVTSISLTEDSKIVLSAENEDNGADDLTLGGLTFGRGDLVAYDPLTGQASLIYDAANFTSGTATFDAVHYIASVPMAPVPVPAGGVVLLTALGGLGALRHRKRRCAPVL